MEGSRIKVALTVKETTYLTQLDTNETVEDILRGICEAKGIAYGRGMFALKVQDFCKIVGTEYVTEENKIELRHGRQLKLSKSPTERAAMLIDRLHKSNDAESSMKNLKRLVKASRDRVVLEALHRQNVLQHLRVYASVRNLSDDEFCGMYKVMAQFLARGYVKTLCEDEVNHLIDVITCEKKMTREMLVLAFEILTLLRKNGTLRWPMNLLRKLTPYVRLYGEAKLQEKSLRFINHLYVDAKDAEERSTVSEFMKSSIMITYVNKYVIREGLSEAVKHQLYLYQKIILRKYGKQLEAIGAREEEILENFEYVMSNIGLVNKVREMRSSTEPQEVRTFARERENISEKARQILRSLRLSLTPAGRQRAASAPNTPWTEHKGSGESDFENEFSSKKIQRRGQLSGGPSAESVVADLDEDDLERDRSGEGGDSPVATVSSEAESFTAPRTAVAGVAESEAERSKSFVSTLARDNLYYFMLNDYKGFEKILLLHKSQLKSVLRTSAGICSVLCRVFEIAEREPELKRGRFVPLCFLYYDYIIERMFCIAMKLYHNSRLAMGVAVDGPDHPVVLKMVEDQLKMALESEPLEFLELEARLEVFTVEEVTRRREREVKEEVKRQLTKEPAFVELKRIVMPRIMTLVKEKRLRFMEGGEHVHQFDCKGQRIPGKRWFLHLSKAHDKFSIEECTWDPCRGQHKPIETVAVSKIKEVESGRKSNFHKEVYYNLYNERDVFFRPGIKQQEPELDFPISLKLHKLVYVDFCAGSQLAMDYWVDGLRFLIGEEMSSRRTEEEVNYLAEVELMEHLAGTEGITIAQKAPPVPPPPPHYNFATD